MINLLFVSIMITGLVLALISFLATFQSYKNFSWGSLGIITSYGLLIIWIGLDLFNYYLQDESKLLIVQLATVALSTSLYSLHWFYDDVSAIFRQRKTMTLGSALYGSVIGIVWIEGSAPAVNLIGENYVGLAEIHVVLAGLILAQALLTLNRILNHVKNQFGLAEHYGLMTANQSKFIVKYMIAVFPILILGSLIYITAPRWTNLKLIVVPFHIIIPIGYFVLSLLIRSSIVSSMSISQPLQAIALVSDNGIKYIHIFVNEGGSVVEDEYFGEFSVQISQLFQEIVNTEGRMVSISTGDVVVVFEKCGDDELILILNQRGPQIHRLLRNTAKLITGENEINGAKFSELVEKNMLYN